MKRYAYTVVGGGAMVQMLKFHDLPQVGKTAAPINPKPDQLFYGGNGFNVYCGLGELGVPVYPVLTHDHPQMNEKMHENALRYHHPQDGIFGPEQEKYYQCLMMGNDAGAHITITYWFGKDVDNYQHQSRNIVLRDAFFQDSDMTLLVMGNPDVTPQTLALTKKYGLPLAYSYRNDSRLVPKDILNDILHQASVLFTNETEADFINAQYGLDHITDLFKLGKADIIVTTLGKDGCMVYDKNHGRDFAQTQVPITQNRTGCVDAVGAGDAFVAGFMYGMYKRCTPGTCAEYGNTASSFVIEKDGSVTNLPTEEQLLHRNSLR